MSPPALSRDERAADQDLTDLLRVMTPTTMSLHWQEQVKADPDKDVAMGVIERVEEPSECCQQMAVVRKLDGSPLGHIED